VYKNKYKSSLKYKFCGFVIIKNKLFFIVLIKMLQTILDKFYSIRSASSKSKRSRISDDDTDIVFSSIPVIESRSVALQEGIVNSFYEYIKKGKDGPYLYDTFKLPSQVVRDGDGIITARLESKDCEDGIFDSIMNGWLPPSHMEQCLMVRSIMRDLATSSSELLSADRAFVNNVKWCRHVYGVPLGSVKGAYTASVIACFLCLLNPRPLLMKKGRAWDNQPKLDVYSNIFTLIRSVPSSGKTRDGGVDLKSEKRVVFDIGFVDGFRDSNGIIRLR
jgi:hypothetical protein